MDEQRHQHEIGADLLRLTRFKGRQLAGKFGFARHDAEDIQQELLLDYVQRAGSFDMRRCSRRTFARLVVDNRVATMIEAQAASCRDYRVRRISLDQPPGAQDSLSGVADLFGSRSCGESLTDRLDVRRVVMRLPVRLRRLCQLLIASETCAEAAARAGISRATLYRHIRQLRGAFRDLRGCA